MLRPEAWALLALLGALVGIQTAYFGLGGGWVVTPLLHLAGFPATWAVGTGMAYLAATSLYSVLRHRSGSPVDLRLGLAYGIMMSAGVELARHIMLRMERTGQVDIAFRALYIVMLIAMGGWMMRVARREALSSAETRVQSSTDSPPPPPARAPGELRFSRSGIRIHAARLAAEGAGIGVISGTLGTGGGFALVPIMTQVHGMTMLSAVTTSLVAVTCTGWAGTLGYAAAGRVDGGAALALFAGSLLGVPIGVRAAQRSRSTVAKMVYGRVLWLGAGAMILGAAGYSAIGAMIAAGGASLVSAWIVARSRKRRSVA